MAALDDAVSVDETPGYVKLLLYGPPGVGKTTFVSDAPNPLWLDFERSTETLRYLPGKGKIKKIIPRDANHLRQIIKELPSSDFETVVFDSISQFQDFQLDEHMRTKFKGKPNDEGRYLPRFQDFRISTELLKELFRILQAMPIHVVLIAHDRLHTESRDDGTTKSVAIRPDMTPRVNDAITRLINICAYLDKELTVKREVLRKLYVNSSGLILAKNRLNIQEIYLENPTWKTLIKDM